MRLFVTLSVVVIATSSIVGCSGGSPTSSSGGPGRSPVIGTKAPDVTPVANATAATPGPGETPAILPTGPIEDGLTIGGVISGLEGNGLVLYMFGDEAFSQNGPFTFTQLFPSGIPYEVRVTTQPSDPDQVCTISNGEGTFAGANVTDVFVDCVTQVANSALDEAFGLGGKVTTAAEGAQGEGLAIAEDGKIVLAGRSISGGGIDFTVVRYNTDGSLDPTFGGSGLVTTDLSAGNKDEAFDVALQGDGKIVVVGLSKQAGGDDFAVVRYNADGSLDGTFGAGGIVTTDFAGQVDRAMAVVIQPDGAIVVAGHAATGADNDFAVARYTAAGVLDESFGTAGTVTTNIAGQTDLAQAATLTPEGAIVVAGRVAVDGGASSDFGLVRYLPDGSLDASFGEAGIVRTNFVSDTDDVANGVVAQADGSIVAAGYSIGATSFDFGLAKYTTDGMLDPTFGTGGLVTTDFGILQDYGDAVALGPSGAIVVVGRADSDTIYDLGVARYLADGSLDSSFGNAGLLTIDYSGAGDLGQDVVVSDDGRIVIGGYAGNGSNSDFALVRVNP